MKNFLILLSIIALAPCVSALPNFDPFAGTAGSSLAGQTDSAGNAWALIGSNQTTAEPVITAGSLSYPNLPPSTGNSVAIAPGSGKGDRVTLGGSFTSGTVFYSFIIKVTDISALPTSAANNFFAGLSDTTGTQTGNLQRIAARLVAKKSGNGYQLGISRISGTTETVYEPDVHNVDEVLFVVAAYERTAASGGTTNVSLWVNPPSSSFGASTPPAATVSGAPGVAGGVNSGDANVNGIRAMVIVCHSASGPSAIIDELRVATSWAYVTGGDPAILQQPGDQALAPGYDANFTVVARGSDPLTYQWQKDGANLTEGGNVSGVTSPSVTVSAATLPDAGSYSVVVTSPAGSVTSTAGVLSISDPAISEQPQSRTNDFGTTATFSVAALGTSPFSYQWQKVGVGDLTDGANVSGSQDSTLSLSAVSLSDIGSYTVTVTGSGGTASSTPAVLTVLDPIIVTQPFSITNNAGADVTFNVTAAGTGPLTYQWKKNGANLVDGANITGALSDTLTISGISATDAASYRVVASGPGGTATSSDASLTVISPVAITSQPMSSRVLANVHVAFVVGTSGTGPISYQWRKNGAEILGATSSGIVVTNAQSIDAGSYSVVVSNVLATVTSSDATLTILPQLELSSTNLVIMRAGNGVQTLTENGNSIFIDQFTPQGTYVNTTPLPDDGPSALITVGIDNAGSSFISSSMTRSVNKRLLVVAGYNTNLSVGANIRTATAAAVPRALGTIDAHGQFTLAATTSDQFSANVIRSGVSDGTNNFWGAGGNGGTYYFGFGEPAATIQTTFSNVRLMDTFNGNLWICSGASGNNGVLKLEGLPTTAVVSNKLFSTSTGSSDLAVNPDETIIYLADDRVTPNGGVQKWQFDGTTWTHMYTLTNGLPSGGRYLTVDFTQNPPVLYVISADATANRLVVFTDTDGSAAGTTLHTAGPNQTLRGVRFGPMTDTTAAPTLSASYASGNLTLTWSGPFVLQSATNVAGAFSDVSGASSPYTTSTDGAQRFYRLRD